MKQLLFLLFLPLMLACGGGDSINIIPGPVRLKREKGSFVVSEHTRIVYGKNDSAAYSTARYLGELLSAKGLNVAVEPLDRNNNGGNANTIFFSTAAAADSLGDEGYSLKIDGNRVAVSANGGAGLFYAVQTLRQLMPEGFESDTNRFGELQLPCLSIVDKPKFAWRGLNLDCCRHFLPKEFVLRYIDLLAYHKMNVLHWHLTEDQGWRIEIKKYPRLTSVGAWRTEADGSRYGGYYTREDINEVVEYARRRHVRVVPEIEMPGHSVAALAAYPQFSCKGEPLEVESEWGVFKDIYCAGNDSTFLFLQDVLSEVVELFPSAYIHIGGDEAPKYRWEHCPKCSARLHQLNLSSYEELQRYFIERVASFLKMHNRSIIGWDEILEGGRPENAIVQAWRGIDRAKEAIEAGAPVIVSPTSHCYFDYPVERVNLEKVYSFDPIPEGTLPDEQHLVLGGECNMWTEYAPDSTIDGKLFPRILAISEILWSYPRKRDYSEFLGRVRGHYSRLRNLGVTYGFERSPVDIRVSESGGSVPRLKVSVIPAQDNLSVRYTLDGSEPDRLSEVYGRPIVVDKPVTLKLALYDETLKLGETITRDFSPSLSTGKPVELRYTPSKSYPGSGQDALTDGCLGTSSYRDGIWQGVQAEDMVVTVDLRKVHSIEQLSVNFYHFTPSWIFAPPMVEFWVSTDGKSFVPVARVETSVSYRDNRKRIVPYRAMGLDIEARYIRMVAKNYGKCPDWHSAAGSDTWLFADELVVR